MHGLPGRRLRYQLRHFGLPGGSTFFFSLASVPIGGGGRVGMEAEPHIWGGLSDETRDTRSLDDVTRGGEKGGATRCHSLLWINCRCMQHRRVVVHVIAGCSSVENLTSDGKCVDQRTLADWVFFGRRHSPRLIYNHHPTEARRRQQLAHVEAPKSQNK